YARERYDLERRVIRHRREQLARLAEATGVGGIELCTRSRTMLPYKADAKEQAARSALDAYRRALIDIYALGGSLPPRLTHWLLTLEQAADAHPRLLARLLAMRQAVVEAPEDFEEYAERAADERTIDHVLRSDLSDAEFATHVAISASCHAEDIFELDTLEPLRAAAEAWAKRDRTARVSHLLKQLRGFWDEFPQEKVLIFTSHPLAVEGIAEALGDELGSSAVATFGAHQEAEVREESARRFATDDDCWVLVCDPLGGEGRNFQFVSLVVHHDLPWSIGAVEQRIGRVDRLGRDGEVPSWVIHCDGDDSIDGAWATVLDQAVNAFASSSSGLEYIAPRIEAEAAEAVIMHGGAGGRARIDAFSELVADERTKRSEQAGRSLGDDIAAFRAAAELAQQVSTSKPPTDAVCRWLRGMGGSVKRDEEAPRAFHLRPRSSEDAIGGVFARDAALRHEHLAFFAQGHHLVDEVISDATAADWCRASAWRRTPRAGVRWEGLRCTYELRLDLGPILTAGLGKDALRRLAMIAPPIRETRFIRVDGTLEDDAQVLEALKPRFDARGGDACLSPKTSRETWMRPLLGGKFDQVAGWQQRVDTALAAADNQGGQLVDDLRSKLHGQAATALHAQAAVADARAHSASARLGVKHADSKRLQSEAEAEHALGSALLAAIAGSELVLAGVAYVVVG
ncbi:MAG: helicase-related protein, partial [Planctomycetota bacterium]